MMTPMRNVSWLALLACLLCLGCAAQDPPSGPSLEEQVGIRKRRMMNASAMAIQGLVRQAYIDIEAVHEQFQLQLEGVRTGPMLNIIDRVLEELGASERAAFRRQVEDLEEQTLKLLSALLRSYEERLWFVVTEAGELENASNPDWRSGHRELDEKAIATTLQLRKFADLEGIHQQATFRAYDRVELVRELKSDVDGIGRVMFFLSEPRRDIDRTPYQEYSSIAFVLARESRDDPREVQWVQAVRHRMERGGISILITPWKLDDSVGNPRGILPLRAEMRDPGYVVSDVIRPVVNLDVEGFSEFQDYHLVSEYRTGLIDAATREPLVTIQWQLRWLLDRKGELHAVPREQAPAHFLPNDSVLPDLIPAPLDPDDVPYFENFDDEPASS